MSKEAKKRKGKADKASIDWSIYPEDILEIPNPNFCFGSAGFQLQNGDVYVGDFCAHKMGIAWREGNGVYITKDNHTYEGVWENDQLLDSEDTLINYPDGVDFRGSIKNNKYNGPGTYILSNKLPIFCNFVENVPVGEAIMTDPQKHIWRGNVGEEYVILRPENHFYVNLLDTRGIGKKIRTEQSEEEIRSAKSIKSDDTCMKELKEIIFKRTTKTVNDFKEQEVPKGKADKLFCTSSKCSAKPKRTLKPKSSLLKAKSGSNISLLITFLSKEYRNSCPPTSVFYPTVDMEN